MLIEVRKDILDKAIGDAKYATNDAALFLSELALAVKRGKHIVYVPALKNDIELSVKLENVIGKNAVILLKSSQGDRSKFNAIVQKLNTKAVCSYMAVDQEADFPRIIHIDPSQMVKFEVGAETYVIGENLSDTIVFDILLDYYASLKKLKNLTRCFYPLMGGGATTYKVYENECKRQRHFCLVITDSDFKLPCEEGKELESLDNESTANKVLDVHKQQNSKVSEFYPMRYVSEIENLITKVVYMAYGADKEQKVVLDHDFSFFDMKKGLCCKNLYSQTQYDYWKSVYGSDVDFSKLDSLREQHPVEEDFIKQAKGVSLLKGFRTDVLKSILEDPNLVIMLRATRRAELSEAQHKEWSKIGELMFNWTCALPPRYA